MGQPLILADHRIPKKAFEMLSTFGDLVLVSSNGLVYEAISGHPDIFFCQIGNQLIAAPNTPDHLVQSILEAGITVNPGAREVGVKYPETAVYNALVTDEVLIHNTSISDRQILEQAKDRTIIAVKQAYSRCNTLAVPDGRFITSDRGIESKLEQAGIGVLYVNPNGIILPGFDHGFIGGCGGFYRGRLYLLGSLNHHPEGKSIRDFLSGYQFIELFEGPLFDGGGLIFLDLHEKNQEI